MHSRFTDIITHTVHTAGTGALSVCSIFGSNVWSVLVEKLRYVAEIGKIYTVRLSDYSYPKCHTSNLGYVTMESHCSTNWANQAANNFFYFADYA